MLNEGLLRGSSISPVLFLIFINDIEIKLDTETLQSLFADDTAIWKWIPSEGEGNRPDEVRVSHKKFMQEEVDKIVEWRV